MSSRNKLKKALDESDSTDTFRSLSSVDEHIGPRSIPQNQPNLRSSPKKGKENLPAASNMRPLNRVKGTPKKSSGPSKRTSPQKSKNPLGSGRKNPAPQNTATRSQLKGAAKRKSTKALKEIGKMQLSTSLLIPKAPFCRLVREFMQKNSRSGDYRISPEALEALREISEAYLTQFFSDSYAITLNRNQVTLKDKDIKLLLMLRGPGDA